MAEKPLLLEIKGNSLDDGPGIRSVVFLKGCPLDCAWCHNPESKRLKQEISFDRARCAGCGTCLETCTAGALDLNHPDFVRREVCTLCWDCVEHCPSGALARVGEPADVGRICDAVMKDKPFFDSSGGGVTLSGGEPAVNMKFLSELVKALKERELHVLIETSGHFDMDRFRNDVLPWTDTVYVDVKFMDPDLHKRYCGVSNGTILRNVETLAGLATDGAPDLLIRTPLVPELTATEENIRAIASFVKSLGMDRMALLEYNPLWHEKLRKIGRSGTLTERWMDRDLVRRLEDIVLKTGLNGV